MVMSIYNVLEYSQSYSMTSRGLCNYYRVKIDNVSDIASDGKSLNIKLKK